MSVGGGRKEHGFGSVPDHSAGRGTQYNVVGAMEYIISTPPITHQCRAGAPKPTLVNIGVFGARSAIEGVTKAVRNSVVESGSLDEVA